MKQKLAAYSSKKPTNYKCGKVPERTPEELREVSVPESLGCREKMRPIPQNYQTRVFLQPPRPPPLSLFRTFASWGVGGEKLGDEPDSRARMESGSDQRSFSSLWTPFFNPTRNYQP